MSGTYRIVRFFADDKYPNETIVRGLTLEQAQAHCSDPESSASSCMSPEGVERTQKKGNWFDGYQEE